MRPAPLHARLRECTADLHARVDRLFPHGLEDATTYRRYLLGMHRFAADHETVIGVTPSHSAQLARDLQAVALAPLTADGLRRPLRDPATRLGWEYVMAGSGLGARRLVRDARRLGHDAASGAAFLEAHAASDAWPRLLERLSGFDAAPGAATAERAIEGARQAFALVHACMLRAFDRLPLSDLPQEASA